jgi:archaeal cell division control protein 6
VDLLTRSVYLAERLGKPVTLDIVDRANEEIERDKYVAMIRTSPKHLQAALYAALIGKPQNKCLHTGDAYMIYEQFCESVGMPALTQRAFTDLLSELDMYGFIRARTVSKGRYGRSKEINVSLAPDIMDAILKVIRTNFDIVVGHG